MSDSDIEIRRKYNSEVSVGDHKNAIFRAQSFHGFFLYLLVHANEKKLAPLKLSENQIDLLRSVGHLHSGHSLSSQEPVKDYSKHQEIGSQLIIDYKTQPEDLDMSIETRVVWLPLKDQLFSYHINAYRTKPSVNLSLNFWVLDRKPVQTNDLKNISSGILYYENVWDVAHQGQEIIHATSRSVFSDIYMTFHLLGKESFIPSFYVYGNNNYL